MLKKNLYWSIIKLSRNNDIFRLLIDYLAYIFYKIFRQGRTFTFNGKHYKYFYHLYNRTVAGERIVEIPIVYNFVKKYQDKNVLEVGNVLSHYFDSTHDVLDKYEKGGGVINKDVATFKSKKKYDLIISVSTMEHVGFNYGEKNDPDKFLRSIKNLKRHLNKGGLLVVTLPIFFNPNITKLIKRRKMPFSKEYYLERISFLNEWIQIKFDKAIKGFGYDKHYANSNVLYVGFYRNSIK